jgi:nicotinamidase-related amidase
VSRRAPWAAGPVALLVVDVQYLDAAPDCGVFAAPPADEAEAAARDRYFDRLDGCVLPNIRRLQDRCRARGLEVVHTRIRSMTRDGRDRGPAHRWLGVHAPPGSKEAEFLPSVAPVGDELVFDKTASSVFNATNIAYVLRNLGVAGLYVTGVYTNECVSTAVRDASDLGFFTTLVEDACASPDEALHEATVAEIRGRYGRVVTTDRALAELED